MLDISLMSPRKPPRIRQKQRIITTTTSNRFIHASQKPPDIIRADNYAQSSHSLTAETDIQKANIPSCIR
jgi:hypothetical protein